MKIETPSIRQVGSRSFFLGACGVLLAMLISMMLVMQRASGVQQTSMQIGFGHEGCGRVYDPVQRIDAYAGVGGVWRVKADGFDEFVAVENVYRTLRRLVARQAGQLDSVIVVHGEELAPWGDAFSVWQDAKRIDGVRASLDTFARRSIQ